jgi:hypothetical protein
MERPISTKAADVTRPIKVPPPQDKPRLAAKRCSPEPPKQRPVTRKPFDVSTPIKADRQQGNPRLPVESTSAIFQRPRDEAYWNEAGDLLFEYFELQAGNRYSETLVDGFIGWLRCSPAKFTLYVEGDDMARAALVDSYLRVVR